MDTHRWGCSKFAETCNSGRMYVPLFSPKTYPVKKMLITAPPKKYEKMTTTTKKTPSFQASSINILLFNWRVVFQLTSRSLFGEIPCCGFYIRFATFGRCIGTPPETNSKLAPETWDGWNTILSVLGQTAYFQGRLLLVLGSVSAKQIQTVQHLGFGQGFGTQGLGRKPRWIHGIMTKIIMALRSTLW